MLRAIFFDLDGTLADDGDPVAESLAEACAVMCRRWPELDAEELVVAYRQVSDTAWADYDRHLRHLQSPEAMLGFVWSQALDRWGLHDPLVVQEAVETYWRHRLRNCRIYPDTVPVLQQLAGRFHLSLLTNGAPAMQRAKFTATGLTPFFQHVFVGGEFAHGKPDPAIFQAALKAADCSPEHAIHIGDSLTHDIAGARGVGISSVWLNRRGLTANENTPDFEISGLEQLLECLKHIGNG
jgi:putative hydrolase of the HAD superfamily